MERKKRNRVIHYNIRISAAVTDDVAYAIDAIAERSGLTKSAWLREILNNIADAEMKQEV